MSDNSKYLLHSFGEEAEDVACTYLQDRGLQLIERNYRCRLGEIDIIMREIHSLVFIEVKARRNQYFADILENITKSKQRKIIKAAMFYLQNNHLLDKVDCRFDVIAVTLVKGISQIQWIKQAFEIE